MASNFDDIEVDRILSEYLSEYEKSLKFNRSLLLLNTFKLTNSSYVIECGLSPARNFLPAIILRQYQDEMIFNNLEWSQLMDKMQKFLASEEVDINASIGNTTISKVNHDAENQMKFIQRLTCFYLSHKDIQELVKIDLSLVSYRVAMLSNLNFSYYYYNVVHSLKECFNYNTTVTHSMNIVEILNVFCESTDNSLISNALREYVYFYKEDII